MESIYTGRTNIKRHARRVIGRNRDMRLQLINRYHLNICYKNIYIYMVWAHKTGTSEGHSKCQNA